MAVHHHTQHCPAILLDLLALEQVNMLNESSVHPRDLGNDVVTRIAVGFDELLDARSQQLIYFGLLFNLPVVERAARHVKGPAHLTKLTIAPANAISV